MWIYGLLINKFELFSLRFVLMLLISLLLSFLVFGIYLSGVSPSVYGGDSGDIILSAWFGGIAHAPGYPLNAIIGWFFTHLPYGATIAYKVNAMAAFFMAITTAILFLISQKLTKNTFIALVTSLIFAFNPLVWLYAHVIEVFQLNLILVAVSVYFLINWRETVLLKRAKIGFLYLAFLFWGFAVFHHQTSMLIAPAYFYLILKTQNIFKKKEQILKVAIYFCIGLLPYSFLLFASWRSVPTNWVSIKSINDLLGLILRADYGTFVASGSLLGTDLKSRFSEIFYFFILLKSDFKIISTVLILVGASYAFVKEKTFFWFFFWAIFFTGPFFLFYAAFPIQNDFYQGLWERFVLITYFFVAFFIAYSFKFILEFSRKRITPFILNKMIAKIFVYALVALFFTVPLNLFYSNYQKADLSKFNLGDWLGFDIFASADDNSIIFLLGDTITFNTEYIYYTNLANNHVRSLKLIRGGSLGDLDYRKRVANIYPMLKFPQAYYENVKKEGIYFIKLLAEENRGSFPVYIIDSPPHIDGYRWINIGLLKKLVLEKDYTAELAVRENSQKFSAFKYNGFTEDGTYEQFIASNIKNIYYVNFIEISDELISLNEKEEAKHYLSLALTLDSDKKNAYLRLGNIFADNGNCDESLSNYKKGQNLDKKDWRILKVIANVYKECLKDEKLAKDYFDSAEILRRQIEDKPLKNF
ncbi:hypothetical protein A2159_01610 [Candidatus Woesebacteria bacterium RBG_13_34_9]|uniref:Uncharacterized protein n=1 Tax=Candidatus Woesebacteria bacterium RBG_13_34_9 TaxID=1802477 RepID=A0A1F7WZM1_9BACT|nr:MAG: hypothetical protein A2159_01610 [Candidatus Woesebacteria bacterium RBG_13_34_9]